MCCVSPTAVSGKHWRASALSSPLLIRLVVRSSSSDLTAEKIAELLALGVPP
jgi:hypothetical protein